MEISEDVKELYDFVETGRRTHGGGLNAGQTETILDRLFAIHRQLIISEYRPPPDPQANVVKLDVKLLAQGGAIKTYARKSHLTPIINLFKRRLK